MRTMLLLLCACCVLLMSAATAAAARSGSRPKPAPCAAKGSTTVAQNVQARVYVRSQRSDPDQHVLVGCLLHSGQRVELASWFNSGLSRGDEVAPQVWLRARIVVVNRYGCSPDPAPPFDCSGSARSVSLRTGEALRRANTGSAVAALVQVPRGTFAYVSSGGAVVKSDATGETIVLDGGPGVDPTSLASAGARVYWLRAGASQSALLSP